MKVGWLVAVALLFMTRVARADDTAGVVGRCDTEVIGGFAMANVHLANPWASALSYEVVVVATSSGQTWRSQELRGELKPGASWEGSFRPFAAGVSVDSCQVTRVGDTPRADAPPGLAVTGQPDRVPLAPFRRHYDDAGRGTGGFLLGAVGAAALGVLGGYVGDGIAGDCSGDFCGLGHVLLGAYIGYTIGFPLGFLLVASHPDSESSPLATFGGSAAGAAVGVLALFGGGEDGALFLTLVLPPVGAMVGFYATHRHTSPAAIPTGALLEWRDGTLAAGVPMVHRRRVGDTPTTTLTLVGGSF